MTLFQLKCFLDLAATLNFSRVAEHYFVTQTAVSYQIRQLEEELGVRLFDRSTRHVRLTDAGRNYYREIASAVDRLEEARNHLFNQGQIRNITVGYSCFCGGATITETANRFHLAHPEVTLMLEMMNNEGEVLERLQKAQIDIGVYFINHTVKETGITNAVIGRCPGGIFYREDYPFNGKIPRKNRELMGETIITYADLESKRPYVPLDERRSNSGKLVQRRLIAKDISSMFEMTRAGLGISAVPALDRKQEYGLCFQRLIPEDEDPYIIVSKANVQADELSDELYNMICSAVSQRLKEVLAG